MSKAPLIATVPLTAVIVGARAGLLRNSQNMGPVLALYIHAYTRYMHAFTENSLLSISRLATKTAFCQPIGPFKQVDAVESNANDSLFTKVHICTLWM